MTILIVEDEPKAAKLLTSYFAGKGYEVLSADSGERALELLQSRQPDLALLDLWLKGKLNGMGVLKGLTRASPKTKAIVITGLDESAKAEALRLGAIAFLRKPIRLDDLDQLLRRAQA